MVFDGLLEVRVNISSFWPHLEFTLLIMKCFASVETFPSPDFIYFLIYNPPPIRKGFEVAYHRSRNHKAMLKRIENQDQGKCKYTLRDKTKAWSLHLIFIKFFLKAMEFA